MNPATTTRHRLRALTLIEVLVALVVMLIIMVSIFSALTFAHRTAQENICGNAAYANVRATMEQILRGVGFNNLPYTDASNNLFQGTGVSAAVNDANRSIPVIFNGNVSTNVLISVASLPDLTALVPGAAAPTGVREADVLVDINNTPGYTNDDLEIKIWLWVQDASVVAVDATQVRAITLIYHWRFRDGARDRWHVGVVRNIRSSAPTF
jgi:type II secretory pathway pseudopilin PulG